MPPNQVKEIADRVKGQKNDGQNSTGPTPTNTFTQADFVHSATPSGGIETPADDLNDPGDQAFEL